MEHTPAGELWKILFHKSTEATYKGKFSRTIPSPSSLGCGLGGEVLLLPAKPAYKP
jgi:hypothetical protein